MTKILHHIHSFRFTILLCCYLALNIAPVCAQELKSLRISNHKELKDFFAYSPDRIPFVSSHRGGATAGFPENSIATFENTMEKIHTFFEVDPRLTKDSVIVVLHDATLDRTTTGKGKLADHTWEEIKHLKLKDAEGNITSYGIPKLEDVMIWAKGKTLLMLDKKDVPLPSLLRLINYHNAESYVLVSSYKVEEAVFYHQQNKHIVFEAFIRNDEELNQYEKAGIPWENIVAYVGKSTDKSLYDKLHAKGVMCIVYTARSIERLKDKSARIAGYKEIMVKGGDIILADNILEVADVVKEFIPKQSSKARYFEKIRKK